MKLSQLISEVMMQEVPSLNSQVEFSLKAEVEELQDSITNYEKSAIKQFENDMKMKLNGKEVTHKNKVLTVNKVTVVKSKGQYVIILEGDGDKIALTAKSSISIENDTEGPTTNVMQNKSVNSDSSQHKIKQF